MPNKHFSSLCGGYCRIWLQSPKKNPNSAEKYIFKNFRQGIKTCWMNGEFFSLLIIMTLVGYYYFFCEKLFYTFPPDLKSAQNSEFFDIFIASKMCFFVNLVSISHQLQSYKRPEKLEKIKIYCYRCVLE